MPTLFPRRPGKGLSGSKNDGGSAGGLSGTPNWAGISSTDFPRLDSPTSEDARPLPPVITHVPERSLSTAAPATNNHRQLHNASPIYHFLAPQKSIDSAIAGGQHHKNARTTGTWHTTASSAAQGSSLHLVPPGSHLTALGMSNTGSASSATKLHALLAAEHAEPAHSIQYGYTPLPDNVADLHFELHGVEKIIEVCGKEIKARGIDVPLIFSSMALDLSATNVKSLISNLLSPEFYHSQVNSTTAAHVAFPTAFLDEVRFANPHDLAALIKWSLARLGRVFEVPVPVQAKGKVQEEVIFMQQRGFIDLDIYMAWRDEERRSHYSLTAFDYFLKSIPTQASALLLALFSLLSSVTAYSLKNGMTPSKISRLFGVLLFGLPEDETFARTYDAFARASNATEHLFLAYIRFLSTTSSLPTRLTESVSGYPSMLVPELTAPGKQARGVPLTQIERTVRLYSVDLIQSAAELDIGDDCPEWLACRSRAGTGKKGNPAVEAQLSEEYRKLINLRGQAIRKKTASERGAGAGGSGSANGSSGVGASVGSTAVGSALDAVTVESYRSLASKQWGDFMSEGFSSADSTKLNFDLRESQRKVRTQAPETRQWSDFAQAGFTINDNGLDNVLNFDDGLKEEMERWPGERAELNERLRQTQKRLPHFPYDTVPRVVSSPSISEAEGESGPGQGQQHMHPISRMDEAFAEVWADYLVGCGWSNRDELTHRNANFVVVQYKSRPIESAVGVQASQRDSLLDIGSSSILANGGGHALFASDGSGSSADDRTDAQWFVIEEVVPAQYRAELEAVGRRKGSSKPMLRKLKLFKKLAAGVSNAKREKQLPQPNGPNGNSLAAGGWTTHQDPDDVFRPGPGGSTRLLKFNDPAALPGGADTSFGTFSSGGGSTRRTSEDSTATYGAQDSAGSRLLSTLRGARSRRAAGGGFGNGRDSTSTPPPPPPPKDSLDRDGLTTPTPDDFSRSQFYPRGAAGLRQRADSLNSADIETRSFYDPEAELSFESTTSKSALLWKRNPLLRHQHRKSKDDAWVDIMMKDPASKGGNGFDKAGDDFAGLPRSSSRKTSPNVGGSGFADESGRRTPTQGSPSGGDTHDGYERTGAATPTPGVGRREPSGSSPIPPSSSTPVISRTSTAAVIATAGSVGLGLAPDASRTSPAAPVSSKFEADPVLLTPRVEKGNASFGDAVGGDGSVTPPGPKLSLLTADRRGASPSGASPTASGSSPLEAAAALSPPSPNRAGGGSPSPDASMAFLTSETDLNSRIALEAATAAQGRAGSQVLAPWQVEAQRKKLEQERIQESLRLARSLREKLKTVEARERTGGSTTADTIGSGSSSVLSSSNGAAAGAGATGPAINAGLRPAEDPFAKRAPGRVADIASRFGGSNRPGRTASGSDSARSPIGPLSPQTTGSEYGFGTSGLPSTARMPSPGASPAKATALEGQAKELLPLAGTVPKQRQVMLDDDVPVLGGGTRPGLAESEGRSSLDTGNFTDGDSIYPDDAASNYSRETTNTDEDRVGGWNYSWKNRAGGGGSGGIGGPGGLLNSTPFPGDAGRSEDEDASMPMPPIFREPYQPGMPLDNVTEESESVISGSNGR
ncbi:hypothetical protein V8E36_003530 [Tilletia maclaganii]